MQVMFVCSVAIAPPPPPLPTPRSEVIALQRLYNSTGGSNWTSEQHGWWPWDFAADPCGTFPSLGYETGGWKGVCCGLGGCCVPGGSCKPAGHVTMVSLMSNNLVASSIPDVWAELPFLATANIGLNPALEGALPASLVALPNLMSLNLVGNGMSGTIPAAISDRTFPACSLLDLGGPDSPEHANRWRCPLPRVHAKDGECASYASCEQPPAEDSPITVERPRLAVLP
jgi:hypothetical protein